MGTTRKYMLSKISQLPKERPIPYVLSDLWQLRHKAHTHTHKISISGISIMGSKCCLQLVSVLSNSRICISFHFICLAFSFSSTCYIMISLDIRKFSLLLWSKWRLYYNNLGKNKGEGRKWEREEGREDPYAPKSLSWDMWTLLILYK